MVKTVFKEIILGLLLILAIILVLGILLYRYVPIAKTMPSQVSYSTPSETKTELAETEDIDESQIVMTYTVNSSDLNNYQRIQDYKPGKANPFASYEEDITSSNNEDGAVDSNGTTSEDANSSTSGGTFFQNKGTK